MILHLPLAMFLRLLLIFVLLAEHRGSFPNSRNNGLLSSGQWTAIYIYIYLCVHIYRGVFQSNVYMCIYIYMHIF